MPAYPISLSREWTLKGKRVLLFQLLVILPPCWMCFSFAEQLDGDGKKWPVATKVTADCIKPTNPEEHWRTLFSFHLITGWTLKCDLLKVIPTQTIVDERECLLQKIEPSNALREDFLAFKKNVICGLMVTRHNTDISSQTPLDNRKVQEIHTSNHSPWGAALCLTWKPHTQPCPKAEY